MPKKRKIVIHIVTIFITLIVLITSSIIAHSYIAGRTAVLEVANELILRNHQSIINKLNYFLSPTPFIRISEHLIKGDFLSIKEDKSLTSFMYIMLKLYPEFHSVYLADEFGNLFLETHYSDYLSREGLIRFIRSSEVPKNTKYISEIVTREKNKSVLTLIYKDLNGKVLKTVKNIPTDFDPRTRPWFIGAKNNIDNHWIGIYQDYGTQKPGLSVAFSVRENQALEGIWGADLSLKTITDALKKFDQSEGKYIFILDDADEVISSTQNGKIKMLTPIKNVTEPVIAHAYQSYSQSKQNHFIFYFNGVEYIVHLTPFAFNAKTTWKVMSIIPTDFFITSLKKTNGYNALFSIITVILGLILVLISSKKISKPIVYLANETNKIAKLDNSEPIHLATHIIEIQTLLDAINKTKTALSSFSKYVPKILVEQLLESKKIAEVGGENKTITILFTDITNFTELTEQTSPQYLMIHLSAYLDALTQSIHKYHGNVDKYIGDAVMAFWGAPIENPNHAHDACEATLSCKQRIHQINKEWASQGQITFPTRFGLALGEAIIGNVGSSDRLNYTAIGDTVNLAARLQALNKTYGTEIIVNQIIYEQCKKNFLFRPLDFVNIRGKKETFMIYELIATRSPSSKFQATPQQIKLCQLSKEGFEAFYNQEFQRALEIFNTILKKYPSDGMADFYIRRCREYL